MMVTSSVLSVLTTDMTSLAVNESNPDVGSSRNRMLGSVMSAMAMFSRLACPPEIPFTISEPTRTSLAPARPRSWSSFSQAASFDSALSSRGRLSSAVYMSISCTVSAGMRVSNCST
mmetsp:Transcript_1852/g.7440  ORF Transcript_1852/g.7440 Transcript_1852/m.7440 type:complete len:117 (+) Transcript_1852:351-701(+)